MSPDHFDALGQIASWAHQSGDLIVRSIADEQNGPTSRGYQIRRHGTRVYLEGTAEQPFFNATSLYYISNVLISNISEETVDRRIQSLQDNEFESREEVRESIAHTKIRNNSQEVEKNVSSLEDVAHEFQSTLRYHHIAGDPQIPDGCIIQQRLYPHEDGFTLRDYDEILSSVVDEQRRVRGIVGDCLEDIFSNLAEDSEQELDSEVQHSGDGHGAAFH